MRKRDRIGTLEEWSVLLSQMLITSTWMTQTERDFGKPVLPECVLPCSLDAFSHVREQEDLSNTAQGSSQIKSKVSQEKRNPLGCPEGTKTTIEKFFPVTSLLLFRPSRAEATWRVKNRGKSGKPGLPEQKIDFPFNKTLKFQQ